MSKGKVLGTMCRLNKLMILVMIALCGQQFAARAQGAQAQGVRAPYVVSFVGRTKWSTKECIEHARDVLKSQGWLLAAVTLNASISVVGEKLVGPKQDKASTVQVQCDYPEIAFFFLATTGEIEEANSDLRTLLLALACDVTGASRQCG